MSKVLFAFTIFFSLTIQSQPVDQDSLRSIWYGNDDDSTRLNALYLLSWYHYNNISLDSCLFYSDVILKMAHANQDSFWISKGLNLESQCYTTYGDFEKGAQALEKRLEIDIKMGDLKNLASTYANLIGIMQHKGEYAKALDYSHMTHGILTELKDTFALGILYIKYSTTYRNQGQHGKAIEYLTKALKIFELKNDKFYTAYCITDMAVIYDQQGEESRALEKYEEGLNMFRALDYQVGISHNLMAIGLIYHNRRAFQEASGYMEKCIAIQDSTGDKYGLARSYLAFARVKIEINELEMALDLTEKALILFREMDEAPGLAETYELFGGLYLAMKDFANATRYSLLSYNLAKKIGDIRVMANASHILYQSHKALNHNKESLNYLEEFLLYNDSVQKEENKQTLLRQEFTYKYEKQKALDEAEQEKILAIEKEEKQRQKIISRAMGVGLVLVIIFSFLIFNRLQVTRKQKVIIEEQKEIVDEAHKEITDSIAYAKRIQSAILPPGRVFREFLKDSFILYKPKDVVAGDFYWMEHKDGMVLFAAADCTGHGVPGAMVSVICHNGLNRSVREYGLTDPGKILDKTREIVIQEFEKSDEEVKDGMDIAMCCLEGMKLQYAGAHNPLWLIRDGELSEYKADKQPIGKFDHTKPHTTHNIDLRSGDSLYIFSDGLADQFGGAKGKKFMSKNFKKLLISIQDKTMEEQLALIDQAFETWRGAEPQVDDVCVIGVRV